MLNVLLSFVLFGFILYCNIFDSIYSVIVYYVVVVECVKHRMDSKREHQSKKQKCYSKSYLFLSFNSKSKQAKKPRKLLPGEVAAEVTPELTPDEIKKNKHLLDEMSGLADQFVSNGELDIYQETYERLKSKLDRLQSSAITTDSSFDMYGDGDISSSATKTKENNNTSTDATLWEYTTDENDKDKLQGPFTTEHMIRLNETEGKLDKDKVRCRRVGTEQFYSIKRIDFDLYLD